MKSYGVRAACVARKGEEISVDDGHQTMLPAGALFNGAELLQMHANMARPDSVLIVPDAWQSPDAVGALRAAGWHWKEAREEDPQIRGWGPWTTYTRGQVAIHVGVLPLLDATRTPLFDLDCAPHVISRRLADFHRMVGTPFRKTPGVVGCALLRDWYETRSAQPRWHTARPGSAPDMRGVGDLVWSRPRTGTEQRYEFVQTFDIHGAYLNAAMMADLPWTDLTRTVLPEFDASRAGFWRVESWSTRTFQWPGDPYGVLSPPLIHRDRFLEDGTVWLTTPVARYLVELGARLQVREAYLPAPVPYSGGPATRRWLRTPLEVIRDARKDHVPTLLNSGDRIAHRHTLKRVPNEMLGLLLAEGGRISRWDVSWIVRDLNRVLLLRKIHDVWRVTGRWPIKVRTDAVSYPATIDDPVLSAKSEFGIDLAASWSPGRWHAMDVVRSESWMDPEPARMVAGGPATAEDAWNEYYDNGGW